MTRGSGDAGTARTRAVAVLREVLERGARAAPLVGERGGGLGEADRGLLRELVLGVLRWKDALDAEIAGVSRVPLPRLAPNLREILEVALYQLRHLDRVPDYAAVSEAVSHAKSSGGEGAARLVNGVLRGILLLPPPSPSDLARDFSHPRFLVERWRTRFGEEATRRILEADNRPPGLDLMANSRRTDRGSLAAALLAEGIRTETSALAPLALTVVSGNPIRSPL
ncbi:MAG TPA: transcription antitermination factor NusB, partial [Thermoanaerobaculia bacterium]|nr:transcription antitermination factor NusB [Thermoanaerobaculia bacterium]